MLNDARVLDWEDTLLLSPAEVLTALVVVGVSVVKDIADVDESETMIGTVVEESELDVEDTVPLVFCLFRSSDFTATSCFAISTNLEARFGFSLWICSRARLSASKMPS